MRITFATLIVVSIMSAECDSRSARLHTENVIVLTIDGPRFSETWGESMLKWIPHLTNDMAFHHSISL